MHEYWLTDRDKCIITKVKMLRIGETRHEEQGESLNYLRIFFCKSKIILKLEVHLFFKN